MCNVKHALSLSNEYCSFWKERIWKDGAMFEKVFLCQTYKIGYEIICKMNAITGRRLLVPFGHHEFNIQINTFESMGDI